MKNNLVWCRSAKFKVYDDLYCKLGIGGIGSTQTFLNKEKET